MEFAGKMGCRLFQRRSVLLGSGGFGATKYRRLGNLGDYSTAGSAATKTQDPYWTGVNAALRTKLTIEMSMYEANGDNWVGYGMHSRTLVASLLHDISFHNAWLVKLKVDRKNAPTWWHDKDKLLHSQIQTFDQFQVANMQTQKKAYPGNQPIYDVHLMSLECALIQILTMLTTETLLGGSTSVTFITGRGNIRKKLLQICSFEHFDWEFPSGNTGRVKIQLDGAMRFFVEEKVR